MIMLTVHLAGCLLGVLVSSAPPSGLSGATMNHALRCDERTVKRKLWVRYSSREPAVLVDRPCYCDLHGRMVCMVLQSVSEILKIPRAGKTPCGPCDRARRGRWRDGQRGVLAGGLSSFRRGPAGIHGRGLAALVTTGGGGWPGRRRLGGAKMGARERLSPFQPVRHSVV